MAISSFWTRKKKHPVMMTENEVGQVLQQLERNNNILQSQLPIQDLVTRQVIQSKPRLSGSIIQYPHYADYTFNLVDQVYTLLVDESLLCPELFKIFTLLKIPIARLVFEEEDFLNEPTHLIRCFLDQLLMMGVGSDSFHEDDIAKRLAILIKNIHSLYDFNSSDQKKLNVIIDKEQRQLQLAATRITGVILGKLRSDDAEIAVEKALGELLELYRIPESMKVLLKIWKKHLTQKKLDKSVSRREWMAEVDRVADILAQMNTVQQKSACALDWNRINQHKGDISKLMEGAHFSQQDRLNLLNNFEMFYRQLEKGEKVLLLKASVKERIRCSADFDMGFMVPKEMKHLKLVEVGQWLALKNKEEKPIHAKVIAKITESSSFVLMCRKGPSIFERSFSEIALGLDTRKVEILSCQKLFTRALEAGVKQSGGVCRKLDTMPSAE